MAVTFFWISSTLGLALAMSSLLLIPSRISTYSTWRLSVSFMKLSRLSPEPSPPFLASSPFLLSSFLALVLSPLQPSTRKTRATANIPAVSFLSMLLLLRRKAPGRFPGPHDRRCDAGLSLAKNAPAPTLGHLDALEDALSLAGNFEARGRQPVHGLLEVALVLLRQGLLLVLGQFVELQLLAPLLDVLGALDELFEVALVLLGVLLALDFLEGVGHVVHQA